MADIKKEESEYVPLPKFYTFPSKNAKERILYNNFTRVDAEVRAMIKEIQAFNIKT